MVPPLVARMHSRIKGMVANLKGRGNARKEKIALASGDAVPLVALGKERKGRIARIVGGPKSLRRLADLGLTRGTRVTVMHSAPIGGAVRVAVRGTSIALGKGVASRIFVKIEGK